MPQLRICMAEKQSKGNKNISYQPDWPTDEFVIVSWFSGEREWIKRQGIDAKEVEGRVYSPEQLRGKIVLGHIPNHLGYLAKEIWEIWTPYRKPDQKGKDLNADELQSAGAKFVKYVPARRIEGNNN